MCKFGNSETTNYFCKQIITGMLRKARIIRALNNDNDEHEGRDCGVCFWGAKVRRTFYKDGNPVSSGIVFECTQDGRPKPCQRGLFIINKVKKGKEIKWDV